MENLCGKQPCNDFAFVMLLQLLLLLVENVAQHA